MAIKALVFDVGGVFRDARVAIHRCYHEVFKQHGLEIPEGTVDEIYHFRGLESFNDLSLSIRALHYTKGRNLSDLIRRGEEGEKSLLKELETDKAKMDLQLLQKMVSSYKVLFASDEMKDGVELFPGSEQILKDLSQKYLLGVLSNSTLKALERDLENLLPYFKFTVVDAKKPSTEIYLHKLSEVGVKPSEAVYIGDAVSDIVMAKRAGSVSVALLCGMGLEKHLRDAKPDYVFKDLQDLRDYACNDDAFVK